MHESQNVTKEISSFMTFHSFLMKIFAANDNSYVGGGKMQAASGHHHTST